MSVWKTLGYIAGGTAIGVAGVVALPIAGPIGAITGLGALIAGGTGGIAGAIFGVVDNSEENAHKNGYQEGYQKAKAEEAEKLLKLIKELPSILKERKEFDEFTIAMFAVAFSVANCDGEINQQESEEIQEFIASELFNQLPNSLKKQIEKMKQNPPNFNTAMEYVKKLNVESWDIFDTIIEFVMKMDGEIRKEEKAFYAAWKEFKNAA